MAAKYERNILLVSVFLVMSVIFISAANAQLIEGPKLDVKLAKYDPVPAKADDIMTIWFDVFNKGTQPTENASFTIKEQYPFSVPGGNTINYGTIGGLASIRPEFRVLIDKTAPEGVSELTLLYTPDGKGFFEKDFNITIQKARNQTDLKVLFVKLEPAAYPGSTSVLTVDITNVAEGDAFYTIASASSDVADIDRKDIFVGTLQADDFESVDFELKFHNNIAPGIYPVNINMVYKNVDGEELQQNDTVYVKVVTQKEAQTQAGLPITTYIITIVIIILAIRFAVPFLRWFLKPFKRKKGEV